VYFDSHKISLNTFIERLSKKLELNNWSKKSIKSFCSELKREIKIELKLYRPSKRIPPNSSKNNTHLYKGKSEFHITMHSKKTLQNGNRELGYLFFENMVRELKGCNIVDKNSVKNLVNLSRLNLGNNLRLHQYLYGFNNIEWSNLKKTVRDKQLSIWSPNTQSVMLSISSKQDKDLCNLELLNRGFEQIAERYNSFEAFIISQLLRIKECNVELGIDVLSSEEEIRELGYEFLPKTYEIYGITFWFDTSNGKIELDISFNCNLNTLIKAFQLIKEFEQYVKLYEKEIVIIEPFSLEKIRLTRNLSLEAKRRYKKRDFYTNKKSFVLSANWIFSRLT